MIHRLYSDLHLEFADSLQENFDWLDQLPIQPGDVALFAGDITSASRLRATYDFLGRRFPDAHVIGLPGNHEYYRSTFQYVWEQLDSTYLPDNVTILDCEAVTIDGQRYLGHTMWYPETRQANQLASHWSDHALVLDVSVLPGQAWFYHEHDRWRRFLEDNLREDDIVVTHMLPSYEAVAPMWEGWDTNCFFVAPMDQLILARKPKAWFFGHTHESIQAKVGTTELHSNPCGYLPGDPNAAFDISGRVYD